MTDLLSSCGESFHRGSLLGLESCRRYRPPEPNILNTELKHSKSDDLVLQSSPLESPSEDIQPRPLSPNLSFESKCGITSGRPKSAYFSDSEPDMNNIKVKNVQVNSSKVHSSSVSSHHVGLYDNVDPEDSIRDMITENDFYKFVLFKTHYDKYLRLSLEYEEARNIAYYLEEKYHEIKAERDGLAEARRELERKLETKELELHEKEEELFLQLEKVVRLEEDCEKFCDAMDRTTSYWERLYPDTYRDLLSDLRTEKEKFAHWKDKLEKERNEAYAQLKLQAQEAENTRRGLERARQEIVRQVTVISAEKDFLERENEELKERLEAERAGAGHCLMDLSIQKRRMTENVVGLEKEVSELKLAARQTATLNSQLKKAMKHLATCRRKKCSVCAYTKASFGEYAGRNDKKLFACFQTPFQDLRNWMRPMPGQLENCEKCMPHVELERSMEGCPSMHHSSPYPSVRSDYSFRRTYSLGRRGGGGGGGGGGGTCMSSPSPSPSLPLSCLTNPHISYIDETSTVSESSSDSGHGEESFNLAPCAGESTYNMSACTCAFGPDTSLTSTTSAPPGNRAFSSDSGFSSDLYDPKQSVSVQHNTNPKCKLERSKWTASFRKLIHRVAKKPSASADTT